MRRKTLDRLVLPALALLTGIAGATTFSGTILDAYTRQPVPHAEVHAYDLGAVTTTDEQGEFELTTGANLVSVAVSRVGYRPGTWQDLPAAEPAFLYLSPEVIRLEGVTISACRTPVSIDRSGPVTVVEDEAVQAWGRTSMAELAGTTPSAITRSYGNFSTVALRGTNTEHTLIALDGVRLNLAQNGTFDLTTLPLILVDRVEVARGGNSALYGSSPVGGLVNAITPRPDRFGANLRTGIGSFGRKHVQLIHTNWYAPVGYVIGGNLTAADNNFDYPDSAGASLTRSNADFESKGLFAKGVFRSGPHNTSLLGEYNVTGRGDPGSTAWPSDSARRDDQRGLSQAGYTFQPSADLRTNARLFYQRFWQNYCNPAFFIDDTHDLTALGGQLDQTFHFAPWAMLMAGCELDKSCLTSTSVGAPNLLSLAGWTQARVEYFGFALNPVVRFERMQQEHVTDSTEDKSTTQVLSPKATLTWSGFEWLTLYAGFGRSFRAPTLNDLYWPEDMFSYGNPHLEPEWSTNWDVGIRGKGPDFLHYWLGYYNSSLTDLIQWQPDTAFRFHPVNVDSAVISGVELDLELDLNHAGVQSNLNYCSARSGDTKLIYRPELSARATVWGQHTFRPVTAQLALTVEHTGERYTDPANTDTLPGYSLFHAEASVSPKLGPLTATARFGVRNLTDERYETNKGYPLPGQTWYGELEFGI